MTADSKTIYEVLQECTVKYYHVEGCVMIQITKVQINDLLLYVNIQAENVMLFRPYFGEMWFIDCSYMQRV